MQKSLTRIGTKYSLGVPRKTPTDPNERLFDCSSLIYWAADQAGYKPPKPGWGAINTESILKLCQDNNSILTVADGIKTRGALLFRIASEADKKNGIINHMAISLGNNQTMEAIGTEKGVKEAQATGATRSPWTHAGLLPGMSTQGNVKENSYLAKWLSGTYFEK